MGNRESGIFPRLFIIPPAEVGQTLGYFQSSINIDAKVKERAASSFLKILQEGNHLNILPIVLGIDLKNRTTMIKCKK